MAEPDLLACEVFDSEKAMYAPISEHYASRDGADSYDPFPSAAVPFDGYAHQQHTSLAVDVFGHPFDVNTPCFAGSPYSHLSKGPSSTRSNSSTETEYSNEDDQQGHICQECNKVFRNFQELDQHTKRVPHKAWRCAEPFCGRTYARRDTFLRHRATHGDKSHACAICSHHNKQKVFKRKDHLKEHIRNCHLPKGTEATCVDGVRSGCGRVSILSTDQGGRGVTARVAVKTENLAMDSLVESLRTVILVGSDDTGMLGELENSLTTLSGSEMKTVASSMAKAALKKTREASSRKFSG